MIDYFWLKIFAIVYVFWVLFIYFIGKVKNG